MSTDLHPEVATPSLSGAIIPEWDYSVVSVALPFYFF